jgi:putative transposase
MKAYARLYPVQVMANVFSVCVSGYYAWLHRKPSPRALNDQYLTRHIVIAHDVLRASYSAIRMHKHLVERGFDVSLNKVKTLRKRADIKCKRHKRYKVTTNSNHDKMIYPNLLNQQFKLDQPNAAWVSDITYIWTNEGWLYLAGVKDLYTKELVGYCLSERMTTNLCTQALQMAIRRRQPTSELIVHSDRGSQYCSKAYHAMLSMYGFKGSMSAKGNCYDNAPIESFWGILKNELVHHRQYQTRVSAQVEITEYIEIFYNRMRIQAKLGYKSPAQAWQQFMQKAA